MSKAQTPARFNGEADGFYDPNFTLDINKRMRVPKNIRVSSDFTDEDAPGTNGSSWDQIVANDKYEMHVPDRILVVGQEQHIGTRAPPREIAMENAVLPQETGLVRVQTPPRILTLDDHYYPTIDEDELITFTAEAGRETMNGGPRSTPYASRVDNQVIRHTREQTPAYNALDVSLPPSEEIQHLRRQLGKLNRRVIAMELDLYQRQQRDKIIYAITIAYFFLKAFNWLSRN